MTTVTRRTSALAGIAIAPLWIGVTAVLTWLEWDYIHPVGWWPTTANEVPYPSVLPAATSGWCRAPTSW